MASAASATTTSFPPLRAAPVRWRDVAWPREHGSWSLAFEPIVFGLLVAPSWPGAGLALGAAAGFFCRRPLRIAVRDSKPEHRRVAGRALFGCGGLAFLGLALAVTAGGAPIWLWLLPSIAAGAAFAWLDLRQEAREQHAELAGSFAFAWLPAVWAMLAGWHSLDAACVGGVMLVRALPTVLTVRAAVRARKSGVLRPAVPVGVSTLGALAVAFMVYRGWAPAVAGLAAGMLLLRTITLLVYPRPVLRASAIGMIEAVLGVVYVVAVALAWRL